MIDGEGGGMKREIKRDRLEHKRDTGKERNLYNDRGGGWRKGGTERERDVPSLF